MMTPKDYNFPGGLKHVETISQVWYAGNVTYIYIDIAVQLARCTPDVGVATLHHACVGTDSTSLCGLDEELFWIHHSIPGRL